MLFEGRTRLVKWNLALQNVRASTPQVNVLRFAGSFDSAGESSSVRCCIQIVLIM